MATGRSAQFRLFTASRVQALNHARKRQKTKAGIGLSPGHKKKRPGGRFFLTADNKAYSE
jgi:hypothetical protein